MLQYQFFDSQIKYVKRINILIRNFLNSRNFALQGIRIHPSNEIQIINFKEYYPDFDSKIYYSIQIDGVIQDLDKCFDWFKGSELGDIFISMSVKKALEKQALK